MEMQNLLAQGYYHGMQNLLAKGYIIMEMQTASEHDKEITYEP